MTGSNASIRPSRRDVLRATGGAVFATLGIAATDSVAAQSDTPTPAPAPAPEDYESILSNANGSGSESDPYVLTTVSELQAVAGELDASYELGAHIDASDTSSWNDGKGFDPIGDWEGVFTGSFDGGEYVISDLTIDRQDADYAGLFYEIPEGTTLERIGLENAEVTGKRYTGGLVGNNNGGVVRQCFTTGTVTSAETVAGGLVGSNLGSIESSYSTATVSKARRGIGGLVGSTGDGSTVSRCYAAGTVSDGTGGVVGTAADNATVEDCYWNSDSIEFSAAATQGTELTETEMTGDEAANSMTGLDFDSVWRTATDPDDFPKHQWLAAETDTETPTGDGGDGGDGDGGSGPGFGVAGALAAISGAGYLLKQRRGPEE